MNIARFSNLNSVLVSLALVFALVAQTHGHNWDPPFQQQYDEHEFLAACRQGRLDIVEYWMGKKDFDPDKEYATTKGKNVSGLLMATQKGHTDITRVLLNNGANPNSPTASRLTPLVRASYEGDKDIVQLLLDHSANPNLVETDDGTSALSAAIFSRKSDSVKADIVDMLLQKGANPNINADRCSPPMFYAIKQGLARIANMLLGYGADPNLPSREGNSPLACACSSGELSIAKALINKGADVNWVNSNGTTPLFYASQSGLHVLVKALLDSGADSSLGNFHYLCMKITPLRIAKMQKPFFRFLDPIHYDFYTKVINLLSHQRRSVPLPAQQHSEPDSAYGTPEHSVVDEDMSSEDVEDLEAALLQVTFQKGAPK